jgi:hypothetical protein
MSPYLAYSKILFWRIAAIVCLSGAIAGAWAYPTAHSLLALGLLAYLVLLWRVPTIWLCVLPALVPILDLTPWSGWFFFEEIDIFILATLAVGYWRLSNHPPKMGLSGIGTLLFALLGLSYFVSLGIGILPLSALDANAFASYLSHYNSLRIGKGFFWACLLLPLLTRATAQDADAFPRWFVPGMVLALSGATLAAWWERWTFVGLSDFATDYRITGMFSGMHVGGAALDGFLALSLPFLLAWILTRNGWKSTTFAAALFFCASYAVLATFSRGLYLALAVIILLSLIAVFRLAAPDSRRAVDAWRTIAAMLLGGSLLWLVFGSGGYRGFIAFVALFAALALAIPLLHRGTAWLGVFLFAPVAIFLSWALGNAFDKGTYIAFVLSALALLVAMDLARAQAQNVRDVGRVITATSLVWLASNAVLVASHWGGARAAWDASLAAGACGVILLLALRAPKVWTLGKRNSLLLAIGLLTLTMAIPILHSYRMEDRFGEAKQDFSSRSAHWRSVLAMMRPGQWAFGAGLGRFAETYFFNNTLGETPGSYRLVNTAQGAALQLGGARYAQGYGESLRVGQRLGLSRPDLFTVSFDAHTVAPNVALEVMLCEKWLLYRGACAGNNVGLPPSVAPWQRITLALNAKTFEVAPWYARPTLQFSVANDTAGTVLEVRNFSLKDSLGRELIRNGDFSHGFNDWFFSSDHLHLPWHAKNLWLNIYFDQGAFGLVAFTLLLIYALLKVGRESHATGIPNLALMASLSGFLLVGMFDSLLDVPRLAWLFYLVVLSAMLKSKHTPRSATING